MPFLFSYYLATSADDSVVKLWDLRKLKNFKTIALEDRYEVRFFLQKMCFVFGFVCWIQLRLGLWLGLSATENLFNQPSLVLQVKSLCFDQGGVYLAVAGSDVQ